MSSSMLNSTLRVLGHRTPTSEIMDPNCGRMPYDMSSEILFMISQELYVQDYPLDTLKNLSLVCHRFHDIASTFLLEHVVVEMSAERPERYADFLAFLETRPDKRSCVRRLTVRFSPIRCHLRFQAEHGRLLDSFKRLLPLLPNLRYVRVEGNDGLWFGEEGERLTMRSRVALALSYLPKIITLSVDWDAFALNSRFEMTKVKYLETARLSIDNKTPQPYWLRLDEYDENSTQVVSRFSSKEPFPDGQLLRWKGDFQGSDHCIESSPYRNLNHSWHGGPFRDLEQEGRHTGKIEGLIFNGHCVKFTREVDLWTVSPVLRKLRHLTIEAPVGEFFEGYLQGQLPTLETLKLSACKWNDCRQHMLRIRHHLVGNVGLSHIDVPPIQVETFLSSLKLAQLSLDGFIAELLPSALSANGPTLRKLRFHGAELSTDRLHQALSKCPNLQWIALDLCPHQKTLPDKAHFATAYKRYFAALTAARALSHIRLFLYEHVPYPWTMTNCEAMAIFAYLRTRKQGKPLESLVICYGYGGTRGLWVIWREGPQRASLKYFQGSRAGMEIWDVEKKTVREHREKDATLWVPHPRWGISDGW